MPFLYTLRAKISNSRKEKRDEKHFIVEFQRNVIINLLIRFY